MVYRLSTRIKEAADSSEAVVPLDQTTRLHVSEYHNLELYLELYVGCETWSLIESEKYMLKLFAKNVLSKVFG